MRYYVVPLYCARSAYEALAGKDETDASGPKVFADRLAERFRTMHAEVDVRTSGDVIVQNLPSAVLEKMDNFVLGGTKETTGGQDGIFDRF